jgi:pyrroline-5-carboxylate reductase
MKQGFIGYGNLANAVYQGLKEDRSIEFAYYARNRKNVDLHYFQDMESLVLYADVIWLAVKPQDLAGVLEQLKKSDLSEKTIISPVAGKSIAYIERYLGNKTTIIRIMPNLAMAFKASVTAFRSNKPDSEKSERIFNLLGKLGKVVKLEEDGFDLFTSVFGSGPAFILAFIKTFKNKIQEFDFPGSLLDELLLELTRGTTLYFMQNQKDYSIEDLIKNITSKGGTTQAGLEYFQSHDIGKHFEGVLDAARNRSKELSSNGG